MKAYHRARVSLFVSMMVLCQSVPVTVMADDTQTAPSPVAETPVTSSDSSSESTREIIVKFRKSSIDVSDRKGLMKAALLGSDRSLITVDTAKQQNLALFAARDPYDVQSILADLRTDPAVESAELNVTMTPQAFPANDTLGSQLWSLENTGQTVNGITGTADADIDATEAWAINEGTHADAVIAVIDTGVKIDHQDLQGNMWNGTNCKDEDGNALGGCLHGYDFADFDVDPSPVSRDNVGFHGTHVAGTIAATKGNTQGTAGVAPHAKIMAIRTDFSLFSIIKSVDFARENGARVINASFGGNFYSQTLFDAFERFTDAGGLVVAAGGNFADDNDVNPFYPASFDLPNTISVAATDQNDGLASFSNTGAQSVDVGAPGVNIVSTSIADGPAQTILVEPFNAAPAGWVLSGTAGLRAGTLAGDVTVPYGQSGAGSATTPSLDLTTSGRKLLTFNARCDTQYSSAAYTDYMQVDASVAGGSFVLLGKFDEFDLDDDSNPANIAPVRPMSAVITPSLISNATVFRFSWVTNGDSDTGTTGEGCVIDDVQLLNFQLVDHYETLNGTSMAAPHVSGIAGLIHGYTPQLTATDVRNIILTTGDEKPALLGKTFTGMRVNALNAMRRSDLVAPVIILQGVNPVTVIQGTPYADAGALASDDIDGDVTARIVTTNPVDTNVLGNYLVRYNATDAAGNAAVEATRTVSVTVEPPDTTPPVITVLGANPMTILAGTTFTDPGATALDNKDGDITGNITVSGTVDINTAASYVLTYSVTDAAGNIGTAQRTVIVTLTPDTTPPVITVLGDNPLILPLNAVFTDPGATALDDRDGNITANIVVAHSVNTAIAGDYIVSYGVSDAAGNPATAQRTVSVVVVPDTTAPVITLLGGSDITVIAGDTFTDPGATALDDRDGTITANIVVTGSVNTNIPDVYTLRYNVSDAAGNPATEVTRRITVVPRSVDPVPPPPDPIFTPQDQGNGGGGSHQGSGGHRGNNSRAIFTAIALLADLHGPQGGFNPANPTQEQQTFLCSVQRMIEGDMPLALVESMIGEVGRLTGLPQEGVAAFLGDGHVCDEINFARNGGIVVQPTMSLPFRVASDGYPVSSNPTWNACVRGNVFNPEIIRQNPDRDPRTGRGWSCDHYSDATNEWHHPDLNVTFMLVPAGAGRAPVMTIPRGFVVVNVDDQEFAIPTLDETPAPASNDSGGAAPASSQVGNAGIIDNAIEERRLRRTILSVDGIPVRDEREEE
ncbi:MAG: DUF5011 domain-containing protein [Candidatus Peribacteraceae bacterium]|nr:DUF5011 domain-containing protein [Candidatus Peribacteraceae bacterium]